jgi:hypothetical protein
MRPINHHAASCLVMTVHAFVDESRRNSTYYIAAAIVVPGRLARTRKKMRSLLLPGQREIHFKLEKPQRRRAIADTIARLPIEVEIYRSGCDSHDEPARQACLRLLVDNLLARGAHRLVIDSRKERDVHDHSTLYNAMGKRPHESGLVYEHMSSTSDELLWIADVAAWCYGTGGNWRTRILPVLTRTCEVP